MRRPEKLSLGTGDPDGDGPPAPQSTLGAKVVCKVGLAARPALGNQEAASPVKFPSKQVLVTGAGVELA